MSFTPTTWNPSDKGTSCTLSNGNLTAAAPISSSVRSIYSVNAGKWYWEVKYDSGFHALFGVGTATAPVQNAGGAFPGADANGWAFYTYQRSKYHNGTLGSYVGGTTDLATGKWVGVKLDMDAGTIGFIIDNVDYGTAYTNLAGKTVFAMFGGSTSSGNSVVTANFGATAFANNVPANFYPGLGSPGFTVSGNIKDSGGANVSRVVRVHQRDTGAVLGSTTSDAVTGNWSVPVSVNAECNVIVLDDAGGTLENDLIARVFPA